MIGSAFYSSLIWGSVADPELSVHQKEKKQPTPEENVAVVVSDVVSSCIQATDEELAGVLTKGLSKIRMKLSMEYVFQGPEKEGLRRAARKVNQLIATGGLSIPPDRLSLIKAGTAKYIKGE